MGPNGGILLIRPFTRRQYLTPVLSALLLSVTGLVTAAPVHADVLCPGQVEVASTAGEFCVIPLPGPGVTVSASGATTVTNNTLVPVRVTSDTGATARFDPGHEISVHTRSQLSVELM